MAFAYLNSATGEAVGNPFMLDICDTKLEHGGITFNNPSNDYNTKLYLHSNHPTNSLNVLTAMAFDGVNWSLQAQ